MEERWRDRHKMLLALPNDLADKLRILAKKENRTLTSQIIQILRAATEETIEPAKSL